MRNVARWFLLCGSVSLAMLLAGCGSGTTEVTTSRDASADDGGAGASSVPEQGDPAAGEPMAETGSEMAETATGEPGTDSSTEGATDPALVDAAAGAGTEGKPASKFPEDVAKWTPDDFRDAARARDQNLPKAIKYLVNENPGDSEVAGLLAEMLELVGKAKPGNGATPEALPSGALQPNNPENSASAGISSANAAETPTPAFTDPGTSGSGEGDNGRGGAAVDSRDLVQVIVDALARNGSQQAWLTLTSVLAGEVKTTVSDDMMTEWVLTAALENYGGDSHPSHQLLKAAVQTPEALNPRRGLELKRQVTGMLVSLAASVMDQLMGVPMADRSRPRGNGSGDPAMEANEAYAEANTTAAGSQGFQNGQQPFGSPRLKANIRPLSDDSVRRAVQFLWQPEMLSYIQAKTQNIIAFEDDVETLALAGSLPMPGVRKTTYELLNGRWQSGAEPMLRQQLYQSIVRDPGMVVVLKLLPRFQPKGPTPGSNRPPTQRSSKSYREMQAKISWMKTSAYMVQAVTKRLNEASQKTGRPNLDPSDLPFKLHKEARIRNTYQLNWPADVSDHVADGAAPGKLLVQYVRMVIDADLAAKTFQFYKRQLKRSKDYSFPQGKWLDSLTTGIEPGTRRSVDIVFMKAAADNPGEGARGEFNGNAGAAGNPAGSTNPYSAGGEQQQNDPGQYTIDVLVIEIPNPKLTSSK